MNIAHDWLNGCLCLYVITWNSTEEVHRIASYPTGLRMQLLEFSGLQLLDCLTTLWALNLGLQEASPFVSWTILQLGPVSGLALAKLIGFLLVGVCIWREKLRPIGWMISFSRAVVAWNVLVLLHRFVTQS